MKYFKESEFVCGKDIVFNKMDEDFLQSLDKLREYIGCPVKITSSYRDPEYNKRIGGSPKSMHMTGKAVDLILLDDTKENRRRLMKFCYDYDLTIGVAKNFFHIDSRDEPTIFGY